jgi:hypothetical protein
MRANKQQTGTQKCEALAGGVLARNDALCGRGKDGCVVPMSAAAEHAHLVAGPQLPQCHAPPQRLDRLEERLRKAIDFETVRQPANHHQVFFRIASDMHQLRGLGAITRQYAR